MAAPVLAVGLDAGGTKTAALAACGSDPIRLTGPGAQLLRDGPEATARVLADLIADARAAFPDAPLGAVCTGVAGAGRERERTALQDALAVLLPDAPIHLVHDAEIALEAAFPGTSGAVLAVGTGSVLYARDDEGAVHRVGGWGWRLGDDGSGAALGRAALRAALAHHDGGPPTALAEHFAEEHGLPDAEALIHAVYLDERPVSAFAPALLACADADDWVAEQILLRETNALGQQAGWLATRLGATVRHHLALTGGLASEPTYRRALDAALARHLPGWTLAASDAEPVEGALRLAQASLTPAE